MAPFKANSLPQLGHGRHHRCGITRAQRSHGVPIATSGGAISCACQFSDFAQRESSNVIWPDEVFRPLYRIRFGAQQIRIVIQALKIVAELFDEMTFQNKHRAAFDGEPSITVLFGRWFFPPVSPLRLHVLQQRIGTNQRPMPTQWVANVLQSVKLKNPSLRVILAMVLLKRQMR